MEDVVKYFLRFLSGEVSLAFHLKKAIDFMLKNHPNTPSEHRDVFTGIREVLEVVLMGQVGDRTLLYSLTKMTSITNYLYFLLLSLSIRNRQLVKFGVNTATQNINSAPSFRSMIKMIEEII